MKISDLVIYDICIEMYNGIACVTSPIAMFFGNSRNHRVLEHRSSFDDRSGTIIGMIQSASHPRSASLKLFLKGSLPNIFCF